LIFGGLYYTVPAETCKTAIFSYFDAFSFSVSVLFTIGFGTNGGDVFFGECVWMQTVITVQVCE
jgi:potassium inwardly-rectifying channel subfamily J